MQWYYAQEGEKKGPIAAADLSMLATRGDVTDDTLVWNETMTDWTRYAEVPKPITSEVEPPAGPDELSCSLCGKPFAEDDLLQFEGASVCAGCKPNFVQQLKENAEISGANIMRYAGFWRRACAVIVDGFVMMIFLIPLALIMPMILISAGNTPSNFSGMLFLRVLIQILQIALPALYSIWLHGKYGATLGKKAMGIKVVVSDGTPIGYGRATGRHFATMISQLILYIGYIMAAFDDEKRALHDHICNTRVIFK